MTELHDASLPWLIARWQEVRSERFGLADTLPCVEPESARDELRHTIEHDYELIRDELARRRALVRAVADDTFEDGCRLLLRPVD